MSGLIKLLLGLDSTSKLGRIGIVAGKFPCKSQRVIIEITDKSNRVYK
jgi:hypothetical protein